MSVKYVVCKQGLAHEHASILWLLPARAFELIGVWEGKVLEELV